jgi:hypothetical protein
MINVKNSNNVIVEPTIAKQIKSKLNLEILFLNFNQTTLLTLNKLKASRSLTFKDLK